MRNYFRSKIYFNFIILPPATKRPLRRVRLIVHSISLLCLFPMFLKTRIVVRKASTVYQCLRSMYDVEQFIIVPFQLLLIVANNCLNWTHSFLKLTVTLRDIFFTYYVNVHPAHKNFGLIMRALVATVGLVLEGKDVSNIFILGTRIRLLDNSRIIEG